MFVFFLGLRWMDGDREGVISFLYLEREDFRIRTMVIVRYRVGAFLFYLSSTLHQLNTLYRYIPFRGRLPVERKYRIRGEAREIVLDVNIPFPLSPSQPLPVRARLVHRCISRPSNFGFARAALFRRPGRASSVGDRGKIPPISHINLTCTNSMHAGLLWGRKLPLFHSWKGGERSSTVRPILAGPATKYGAGTAAAV